MNFNKSELKLIDQIKKTEMIAIAPTEHKFLLKVEKIISKHPDLFYVEILKSGIIYVHLA
jgi:hypothetical protein